MDRLSSLAREHFRPVLGVDGRAYAVAMSGAPVALPVLGDGPGGLRFRLARLCWSTWGRAPTARALTTALAALACEADGRGPVPVSLRVARHGDGVALDLGRADGRCVLVGPTGWRVVDEPPVLFRRTALIRELPVPIAGGALGELHQAVNVAGAVAPPGRVAVGAATCSAPASAPGQGSSGVAPLPEALDIPGNRDSDPGPLPATGSDAWRVVVAWLVCALLLDVAHPTLALVGGAGCGKTTTARTLVSLVDPSPAPLRRRPRDLRSWATSAAASWVVGLDDVDPVTPWLANVLASAVDGTGIVHRAGADIDDVATLALARPVVITTRALGDIGPDLARRLVAIQLDDIPTVHRRPEAQLRDAFARCHARSLGALLDVTACVLGALPEGQGVRPVGFGQVLDVVDAVTQRTGGVWR